MPNIKTGEQILKEQGRTAEIILLMSGMRCPVLSGLMWPCKNDLTQCKTCGPDALDAKFDDSNGIYVPVEEEV